MKIIKNQTFDEERSLYSLKNSEVRECIFEGENDGESALKEARNIKVDKCRFSLRYPLWHVHHFHIKDSIFKDTSRAPLWYSSKGEISNIKIYSVKALRECDDINIVNSEFISQEFGWKCRNIGVLDSFIESEYVFFESKKLNIDRLKLNGKYSFQYVKDVEITNSELNTKDAFWHSKNVVVRNSVINGEYLGWYSNGLTLINCKIKGTQPLCYCKNLKLINCEMINCDLAFEYSDVEADIIGHIDSIKNPRSGVIRAGSVGEIIKSDSIMKSTCEILIK